MADMKTWGMYIGGEWVESGGGETEPNINPSNGEAADHVQIGTREDADRAVDAAQKAYDEVWFDTPAKERSAMMFALADAMDADAETLAKLEAEDVGKPISVSSADIPFITDNLRFFAGAARHLEGKSSGEYEKGFTSIIRREPLGVTAGICPWNYPLMMSIWKVGPALAAGNTSVIKPAEITPRTALRLAELSEGILPPGVLNIVTGRGSVVGDELVKNTKVRLVSVTGDTATGKVIAANAAASNVKRAHLELGGKAPVVVFDDADLDKVVETLKFAGYTNTGQDCTASCRVIAGPGVYEDLLSALVPTVESIVVGPIMDESVEMG
ncbi:MAG: aldehyde dehydrogenase family protein, partial [Solirubrobacterales bacterium]